MFRKSESELVADIKKKNAEEIVDLKRKHDRELTDIRRDNAAQAARTAHNHELELERLEHTNKIVLEKQVIAHKAEVTALQNEKETIATKATTAQTKTIAERDAEIAQLRESVRGHKEVLATVLEQHKTHVQVLTEALQYAKSDLDVNKVVELIADKLPVIGVEGLSMIVPAPTEINLPGAKSEKKKD